MNHKFISLLLTVAMLISVVLACPVVNAADYSTAINSEEVQSTENILETKIDVPNLESEVALSNDSRAIDTSIIALNYTSLSVNEGGIGTIVVSTNPSGATVSWSSSYTNVASITMSNNSKCTLQANKAGSTEITASVTVNGTVYTAKCTVYVNIANGVYYIKNVKSGYYAQVQSGKITNGTDVIQTSKHSTNANLNTRASQMWKVYYLGDGRYSVRPMHKLNMGLDVTSGNVDIYNINTTDTLAGVPSYAEWQIKWDSNGYVFMLGGVNTNTMMVSGSSTSSGASLVTGTYSSTNSSFKWTFETVSSPPTGLLLYDTSTGLPVTNPTRYVAPEETRTLSNLTLAIGVVSPTSIAQTATWTAFGYADVNSSTGSATGLIAGTTTVTATANNYSVMYTLKVTEIPNGVYLIKNRQTGYYTDIQGPTMANGTKIHQWIFHGGKAQKWTFTHTGDGYYSVKTTYSTSSYYLGVINDSTTVDVDIVLRNGTVTNGMKWRVETTTDGAVKLVPKTGSTYALATTTSSATNGAKLIQGAYVNNTSYRDEWYLHQVKDFSLVYLGEYENDPAMVLQETNALHDLRSGAGQKGYSFRTITKDDFFVQLATCEFFNVITHGGIPNGMELTNEWIYTTDFTMYNSSALSNLKFACILVCNNGEGGGNADNIVNSVYSKGAQCVLGFKRNLFALAANYWNEHLVTNLTLGYSIDQSIANADSDLRNSTGTGVKYTILGQEDWDPNTDADTHPKYLVGDSSIVLFQ